ncbi:IS110 family transposase [Brevibacterium aurantiacum]|uniref:IS110 family transposase n=1 Tax=Brevibacterium aurantiacum TaxID=273384 RepID=A0A556CAN9_BREAU|nr:IS110 family transposase [Brevibacterium aurantiacum]TSI14493.1 IS110 family transposase [Brevibacterium aurantiacum]
MTIVAHTHPFVIGVDTHARNHALAVLTATGEIIDTAQFPTTTAGMARAISWAARRTGGDLTALWVIEGVASYGAGFAAVASRVGYEVVEAARMNARANRGVGKSDPLDAHRIAAAVLPLETTQLRQPRLAEGVRSALQVLVTARDHMTAERTATVNALIALLRVVDLGIDARRPLTRVQVGMVARWRSRDEDLGTATARTEAIRMAKRVVELDEQIAANSVRMDELVQASQAAPLLEKTGIGTVTAAICLTAWSHHGRVRSEAAFAALAGVNPIPASSGNTVRHRLNRGGDRRLNRALHIAALTRMTHHPETRAYVEKRQAEGRTTKEIRRCLKRYLARQIYRILNATETPISLI